MAQHEFTPQPELGNPDGSLNFVNHKLQILNDGPRGMGVITGSYINKGETLVVYGGGFVDSAHISAIPSAIRPFYFQVATNIWYGHGLDKIGLGIAERINHSCSPNAGFRGIADIIAIRDIQRGESITIDYATLQSDELDGSCFDCACGATNCRKMVTINDWQQVTPNDPDYTLLQPFLQSRISKESSLNASVFSSLMFPSGWQSPVDNNILRSTLLSESLTIDHQHARAAKPIRKNEVVGLLGGQVISNKSIASLAPEIRFSYRAISDDHFIGPKNDSDAKITMVLRSGDAPNLEIKLNHFVVANRDIEAGEVLAVSSKGFWQGTDRPLLKSVGTAITGSLNKLDTESGHPPLKIVGSRCGRAEFATAQNHLSNLDLKQANSLRGAMDF